MVKSEIKQDKKRFEKLKDAEVKRGRDTEEATDVAAREVKELRRREGRSKENPAGAASRNKGTSLDKDFAEPAGGQSDPPDSVFQKSS